MDYQTAQDFGAWPIQNSTQRSYSSKVRTMQRYSERLRYSYPDNPDLPEVSIADLVQDLCERDDLAPETKHGYRTALLRDIKISSMHDDDKQYEMQRLEAVKLSKSKEQASDNEKITSAKNKKSRAKKRSIPVKDENALLEYLGAHSIRSLWAYRTCLLVRASEVTGLRNVEWVYAEWNQESGVLHVRTAKQQAAEPAYKRRKGGLRKGESATQARVKPVARDIPVSECDQQLVLDHISEFERAVPKGPSEDERREEFRKYYDQCKCAFSRACLAVFGERRYWLKTFRSQFSANMKALHGSAKTATLMGHSGPDSPSASHYGKANQAHARFKGRRPKQDETQLDSDSAGSYPRER